MTFINYKIALTRRLPVWIDLDWNTKSSAYCGIRMQFCWTCWSRASCLSMVSNQLTYVRRLQSNAVCFQKKLLFVDSVLTFAANLSSLFSLLSHYIFLLTCREVLTYTNFNCYAVKVSFLKYNFLFYRQSVRWLLGETRITRFQAAFYLIYLD